MAHGAVVRIGTSGYAYDHWRDVLYPQGLPKDQWLRQYAENFDSVEINNTFYNLPSAKVFRDWASQVPKRFCFALKFSRFSTHMRKLKEPEEPLRAFLERATLLGEKLGPILVQLPPRWHVNTARLEAFLQATPKRHRWAVEFRDGSWLCEEVYAVLRAHNAALCIHDLIADHPQVRTADWVYFRFHGAGYAGDYPHHTLNGAGQRIRRHLDEGLDVFVYFNNDLAGAAVRNARELRHLLGLG